MSNPLNKTCPCCVPPWSMRGSRGFITTRCYSAAGELLWVADHGARVLCLAVDSDGNVYQSGEKTGYLFGASYFHSVGSGALFPYITKHDANGVPDWRVMASTFGSQTSEGLCVSNGGVYELHSDVITKYDKTLGTSILNLPMNFESSPLWFEPTPIWPGPTWGGDLDPPTYSFLACTENGYVVAFSSRGVSSGLLPLRYDTSRTSVHQWREDTGYGVYHYLGPYGGYQGLGITGTGTIVTSASLSQSNPHVPPDGQQILEGFNSDIVLGTIGTPVLDYRSPIPMVAVPNDHQFRDVACSPNGRVYAREYNYAVGLDRITQIETTGDIRTPTLTGRASPGQLRVGVVATYPHALAVNDDGIYAYARDRDTAAGNISHEIRASDDSLIGQYDHGGYIWAAAVLPDGKVIVAGDRVPWEIGDPIPTS